MVLGLKHVSPPQARENFENIPKKIEEYPPEWGVLGGIGSLPVLEEYPPEWGGTRLFRKN